MRRTDSLSNGRGQMRFGIGLGESKRESKEACALNSAGVPTGSTSDPVSPILSPMSSSAEDSDATIPYGPGIGQATTTHRRRQQLRHASSVISGGDLQRVGSAGDDSTELDATNLTPGIYV